MNNIVFYSLCALYVANIIMLDITYFILRVVSDNSIHDHLFKKFGLISCAGPSRQRIRNITSFRISISSVSIFGFCDFIASSPNQIESILVGMSMIHFIYRCWIIWGDIVRVIIIPTISAFAFLGS